MSETQESLDRGLDAAVARALQENLAPLQRSMEDFQKAYNDFVAACASGKPLTTLPAMLRAQWAAAAVSTGLNVLSNFVTSASHQHDLDAAVARIRLGQGTFAGTETERPVGESQLTESDGVPHIAQQEAPISESHSGAMASQPAKGQASSPHGQAVETPVFDVAGFIASLPPEQQDLHRRANRVAKVTMQDIKLLKPGDVQQGRENKDLCGRLRNDLDKARREYDRRFKTILEHPVDYFHYWMVEILADGRSEALGEYPYPSPVLRR